MEALGLLSWVGLGYVLTKKGGGRVPVFFSFFLSIPSGFVLSLFLL